MLGDTCPTIWGIWGDTGSSEGHGGQRTLGRPGSAQTRASCVLSVKFADMSVSASTCWAAHGQSGIADATRPPGIQSHSSGDCPQEPPGPTPFCPRPPQWCATTRLAHSKLGRLPGRERALPWAHSFQIGHHRPTWPSLPVCAFFHLPPPTRAREGGGDISAPPLCPNRSSLEAPAGVGCPAVFSEAPAQGVVSFVPPALGSWPPLPSTVPTPSVTNDSTPAGTCGSDSLAPHELGFCLPGQAALADLNPLISPPCHPTPPPCPGPQALSPFPVRLLSKTQTW